jgi:hypothetical protein
MFGEVDFHRLAKLRLDVDDSGLYVQFFRLKVYVYFIDTGIHMADFSHMLKPATVLLQKRRNLYSW